MAFAASSLRVWPSHSLGHLLVLAVVAGTSVAVEAVILVQAGNIPRCGERKGRGASSGTRGRHFHGFGWERGQKHGDKAY